MKRFEGESSRQKAYNKRKDKIIRKAQELTTLCETDLALLMFSPDGQLTSFGSNGRVEDTFIRFLELSDEYKRGPIQNAEQLTQKLRELKKEAEVLEKMATIEALQEKLAKINRRTEEVREKLRFYNPDVEKINSAAEAELHEQFLVAAIERVKLSKEKLFGEQAVRPETESKEVHIESKEDKLLGKQIMLQDTESHEDKLLGEQIVPQVSEISENQFGKQILQQDSESYKDKWLGKCIMGQGTSSYEDKLLGKQILQHANSNCERVAGDMKCPVPFADQSANTVKRRRGRPHKNRSPHMNIHLSNDSIQAQKSWNMQGGHSSMINKQILQQGTTSNERVVNDMKSPVPITDQSANTNKRRRGRPRKNRSPHINTHLSNNLIQAHKDWDPQASQHSSMINKQI